MSCIILSLGRSELHSTMLGPAGVYCMILCLGKRVLGDTMSGKERAA